MVPNGQAKAGHTHRNGLGHLVFLFTSSYLHVASCSKNFWLTVQQVLRLGLRNNQECFFGPYAQVLGSIPTTSENLALRVIVTSQQNSALILNLYSCLCEFSLRNVRKNSYYWQYRIFTFGKPWLLGWLVCLRVRSFLGYRTLIAKTRKVPEKPAWVNHPGWDAISRPLNPRHKFNFY